MTKPSQIEELVHYYIDGALSRRQLVGRLARYTGGLAAAAALVKSLGLPTKAAAQSLEDIRVPENAPDLESQMVEFRGEGGLVFSYLSRPRELGPPRTRAQAVVTRPGVLVIHENRGLNDHIKDVTRRVARAGFVGLGIDLVSRQGGTHLYPDPTQAGQAYNRVNAQARLEDMITSVAYLKALPYVKEGRVGAVGFCAGGQNCFTLAVNSPDIVAVPFYGNVPAAAQLEQLSSPLLGIFAERDTNLTRGVSAALTTLLDRRKTFGVFIYEGVGHAFHNDTGPAYNREAASDAWARTLAFFTKHL